MNKKYLIFVVLLALVFGVFFGLVNIRQRTPMEEGKQSEKVSQNLSNETNDLSWISKLPETFDTQEDWEYSSAGFHQGKLQSGSFTLKEDKTSGHYGIKFENDKFNKLRVKVDVSKTEGKAEIWAGTSNNEEDIINLIYKSETLKDRKSFELKNGMNTITIDLNWANYTFLKFRILKRLANKPSPKINRIIINKE